MTGFFVASTGQHVGKTTTCLGLVSGLKNRFASVGFMKPVGQEQTEIESGLHVDKDVILFKDHFGINASYEDMSPVLFPPGFTRDYLDGKIDEKKLAAKVHASFERIQSNHSCVVVEGTGHIGVGSIIKLNNAQVAKLLGLPIILVASGGLGSSFDAAALNYVMCEKHGVKIKGVILNRVLPDKRDMIIHYMTKALERWNIPVLGCIPFDPFLSNPTMKDFEQLFQTSLLAGEEFRLRHFKQTRLVATSVETYKKLIAPSQLIITPAARDDIILATLDKYWELKLSPSAQDLETGLILTGDAPPKVTVIEQLRQAHIPTLYAPVNTYVAMKMITSYTAKIPKEDLPKIKEAIDIVESHIDFEKLCTILKSS